MRVPAAQQRGLLELQSHDTRLARLAHEGRTLPVLARLADASAEREAKDGSRIRLEATLSDQRRELARMEADIDKVVSRRRRHEERLEAGSVPAKEMMALQGEIEHLIARQGVLEDEQLELMEISQASEEERDAIVEEITELDERMEADTAERDLELGRLRAASAAVQAQRDAAAAGLPTEAVELYEEVRAQTGGLAVVGLNGLTPEGISLDFTLSEQEAIRTAEPDELLQSEDYGYILVRL